VIPAAFEYTRATSIDEALSLLSAGDPSIRVLAGGQSILPLMKLRLARPERLIDVGRLPELRGVRELDGGAVDGGAGGGLAGGPIGGPIGGLAIGALTTWATLLADERVTRYGALADVLPQIGDVQVRNLGTIGGSLAHADPASDIAAPALALGFELVARSAARGERTIAIEDFFEGAFVTALAPDELLVEVRIPAPLAGGASAYVALPQLASGYPIAGVAVSLTKPGGGAGRSTDGGGSGDGGGPAGTGSPTRIARIGVTGVGEQPYRASALEAAVSAGSPLGAAIEGITDGQRVGADIHADREYRSAMAKIMARRALDAATART
jgi:carbon-monoxide dehydrogenase medium subunit